MQLRMAGLCLALTLGAASVVGCGGSDSNRPNDTCKTFVGSGTSPATGVLTLHGSFFANESVLIRDDEGHLVASGTPESDRSEFTLTPFPSGNHSYEVDASCDGGQDQLGVFTFNVQ